MDSFKITTWNIEHADKLLSAAEDPDDRTRDRARVRLEAVAAEIAALEADVLLVCEGPSGEARATEFFARVAPGYRLLVRGVDDRDAYGMRGNAASGAQWLWSLVRGDGFDAQLLHLDRWRTLTERASSGEHQGGRWTVSLPRYVGADTRAAERLEFDIVRNHQHWRHPQVVQMTIGGQLIEVVNCHLKSKYNRARSRGDPASSDFFETNPALVAALIEARVKLSTECADIRYYIDARFAEDADAAIIVAGDLNDGPGKELVERRFLYHDLIGVLQGDVFFARRFLNHALFDAPDSERWSVHFRDRLDPARNPHILLDHILFTQSLTTSHLGRKARYVARAGGGRAEHQVHHRVASSFPRWASTSDHTPVSMIFDRRREA
ncbi:endonuclease/exonuclease/phosphatase [Salinarimonas chemoclinalis]|uniref:endonuclease/exonuclease/phosphatase n=1 Tax=Salinarimonas chemoclinalis TaxID=3241599 RepID=UPI00355848B6